MNCQMKKLFLLTNSIFFISISGICQQKTTLEKGLIDIGTPVITDTLNNTLPSTHNADVRKISATTYHVQFEINPSGSYDAGCINTAIQIPLENEKEIEKAKRSFHWLPNIKNEPGQVVSQHVFRSPCIILTLQENAVIFIPDLHEMRKYPVAPYYFDLDFGKKEISINYGISNYDVVRHQYYKKNNTSFAVKEKLKLSFYILVSPSTDPLVSLQRTNNFLWQTFASEYTSSQLPQTASFRHYAQVGYTMALDHYWVNAGKEKGGITLSTFYDKQENVYRGRFYKNDIWYHSWFNSMRTAYGLYYWGRKTGNEDWKQKALASVKLLLDCPRQEGWFPTIFASEENKWVESGQGGGAGLFHTPDNAWTAYWLMRFNNDFVKIDGADKFLQEFARSLLKAQDKNGCFPARIKTNGLTADSVLQFSSSSAMPTWFLLEMMLSNKINKSEIPVYRKAVERSLEFLAKEVLPQQRFEDFELYFSCSRKPMNYYDSSTCMYGQNTLAIQWCAEAYLKAWRLFKNKKYLTNGEYCLNILSLYQQVWNPPYINLYAFGGFGVMNTDAEWNDARQAQFAETYLGYYLDTKKKEYKERSIAACRAAFALMVLPENKDVCPANYKGTPFNGESFTGTMAENYGHDGYDKRSYQSGFHWGTGSALTSAAVLYEKFGDEIDIAGSD